VNWRGWAGVRDIIVHAYNVVDLEQVWSIASEEVPPLRTEIQSLLAGFAEGTQG